MALALRSKTGCLRCRRRRIKCDEQHPVCQRCKKSGIECIWQEGKHITSQQLQSISTLGDTYASLFLQTEFVEHTPRSTVDQVYVCPIRQVSSGFPPLRNVEEHRSLVKLSSFLSMVELSHAEKSQSGPAFEFTVALSEPWVRDALIAFAGFLGGTRDKDTLWKSISPYYSSATIAVRYNVMQELDETRLEKLLVTSLFLGMIEINNPYNEVFPLLHFEAVGRFLEALNAIQIGKQLSAAIRRFHRIALESYLYHVAIQSLYWPQTDRYAMVSLVPELKAEGFSTKPEENIIVKVDLRIYIILLKLVRLARVVTLNETQQNQALQLREEVALIENEADVRLQALLPEGSPMNIAFCRLTQLTTSTLAILNAKVLDRSLLSSSAEIQSLSETALTRLEGCEPIRAWTGDFAWIFAILSCAVNTSAHCERLSQKIKHFSTGLWGSDLKRTKKVLELVRQRRLSMMRGQNRDEEVIQANDPLHLLVEARLSLN